MLQRFMRCFAGSKESVDLSRRLVLKDVRVWVVGQEAGQDLGRGQGQPEAK